MMLCCLFLRSNHCFWGLLMTRRSIWRGMPLLAQLMDCVPDMIGVSPCLWENNPTKAKLCCPLLIEGTQRLEKVQRFSFDIVFAPGRKEHFISALFVSSWVPSCRFIPERWVTYMLHALERHIHAGLWNFRNQNLTFQNNSTLFDFVCLDTGVSTW